MAKLKLKFFPKNGLMLTKNTTSSKSSVKFKDGKINEFGKSLRSRSLSQMGMENQSCMIWALKVFHMKIGKEYSLRATSQMLISS